MKLKLAKLFLCVALALPSPQFHSSPKHPAITLDRLLAVPTRESEWEAVRRYAVAVIHSKGWRYNDVQEMAQEACLQLLKSIQKGIEIENVKAYTSAIVTNVIRARYAKLKDTDQLNEWDDYDPRIVRPEDWIFDAQIDAIGLDAVRFALTRLKPLWNRLLLAWMAGTPGEETMQAMNLSPTQYRLHLNRAKMKLVKTAQFFLKNPILREAA